MPVFFSYPISHKMRPPASPHPPPLKPGGTWMPARLLHSLFIVERSAIFFIWSTLPPRETGEAFRLTTNQLIPTARFFQRMAAFIFWALKSVWTRTIATTPLILHSLSPPIPAIGSIPYASPPNDGILCLRPVRRKHSRSLTRQKMPGFRLHDLTAG